MEKKYKKIRRKLAAGIVFLLSGVILQYTARNTEWFAQWYTVTIYPLFVTVIGRIMSVFPFSVVEILLYGMIIFFVLGVVRGFYKVCKKKNPFSDMLLHWSSWVCMFVGILFFVYTVMCGINYHTESFAQSAGIHTDRYTLEELKEVAQYLTGEVNQLSAQVERNEKEIFCLKGDTKRKAVEAMHHLAETYSGLQGYYPFPKPLIFSEILSYQQLSGIYSPFTIEANYNADMQDYNIPFTMCHELSHLRGYMSEDEANFIAYLACVKSEQVDFQYSGMLLAWTYVTNALYVEQPQAYESLLSQLKKEVLLDLQENKEFWDAYDGVTAEIANKVNDTYLKANRQVDGVKSYGKVVDLILADYLRGSGK